jgi:hypothetical protein
MATADVLLPSTSPAAPAIQRLRAEEPALKKHNVETTLNYYKDPGDGSEPGPMYIGYARTKYDSYSLDIEHLLTVLKKARNIQVA